MAFNMEQVPDGKVVSEIVRKKQPYKEIEAIINDNRVIIRMHKEPLKEEYDPPCECIGQVASKEPAMSQRKCDDRVLFDMTRGNLELCRVTEEDVPSSKKRTTCEEAGCRVVTLYPNIKDDAESVSTAYHSTKSRKVKKPITIQSIDPEENPNIFLLRIKKSCVSGDKKQTMDLEFRAPRPWQARKEQNQLEHEDDTDEKYEDKTYKEHEADKKDEGGIDEKFAAHGKNNECEI